jgi:metal-dependent amidase/aminoacylase/carboxypeptidase family protein
LFKEFNTSKLVRETLEGFGITNIKDCAKPGLIVDIEGTGDLEISRGALNSVALRADMDGLPIPENNPGLDYRTKTDFAHMCGHDGHMVTLLTTA